MFTADEKKDLTIRFWKELKEKLDSTGKLEGRNIDWMNYPNKINHLYFRMEANTYSCKFCIDIQFLNAGVREVYFQQFEEFKTKLDQIMPQPFSWLSSYEHPNSKTIARLFVEHEKSSIYNEQDWPKSHQFLIDSFMAFDTFWREFGDMFRNLK